MKSLSYNIAFFGICVILFIVAFQAVHSYLTPRCEADCYAVPIFAPSTAVVDGQQNYANQIFLNHPLSYWVVTWYKWMLPQHPSATKDPTGLLTMKYQPVNSPIYFLAEEHGTIDSNRHITMPQIPIMFPALNKLVLSYTPIASDKFTRAANTVIASQEPHSAYAYIDGKPLKTTFVKTGIFGIHTYDHNAEVGNYHEGDALGISSGYWVFLNDLSIGNHTIQFFGGAPNYVAGATYYIKVIKT